MNTEILLFNEAIGEFSDIDVRLPGQRMNEN